MFKTMVLVKYVSGLGLTMLINTVTLILSYIRSIFLAN